MGKVIFIALICVNFLIVTYCATNNTFDKQNENSNENQLRAKRKQIGTLPGIKSAFGGLRPGGIGVVGGNQGLRPNGYGGFKPGGHGGVGSFRRGGFGGHGGSRHGGNGGFGRPGWYPGLGVHI